MVKKFSFLEAFFYKTASGNEPVREWMQSLTKEDKKILGEDIRTVQLGWPLGMPLVKFLGKGLWEVRSRITTRRIARVIFFMDKNTMILLNGFIKKTQKTPQEEIDLALKRKKEFIDRGIYG